MWDVKCLLQLQLLPVLVTWQLRLLLLSLVPLHPLLLLLFPRQGHHGQGEIKSRFILSAMSVSRMSLPASTQKTNI